MDTPQLIASLLGAGSGGAILLALVNGFVKWLSGSAGRERIRNADYAQQYALAVQQREDAERDRDAEARKRRKTEEYASKLRRQLIEEGIEPGAWPADTTVPQIFQTPTKEK